MCFFFALCALHFVQNFVTLVDPRPGLLLASKVGRVVNVADDASVLEMEFGREIKLNRPICWVTRWCSLPLPSKWEDLGKLTAAFALAFVYNAVGLRERMNGFYFDAGNRNLVTRDHCRTAGKQGPISAFVRILSASGAL